MWCDQPLFPGRWPFMKMVQFYNAKRQKKKCYGSESRKEMCYDGDSAALHLLHNNFIDGFGLCFYGCDVSQFNSNRNWWIEEAAPAIRKRFHDLLLARLDLSPILGDFRKVALMSRFIRRLVIFLLFLFLPFLIFVFFLVLTIIFFADHFFCHFLFICLIFFCVFSDSFNFFQRDLQYFFFPFFLLSSVLLFCL